MGYTEHGGGWTVEDVFTHFGDLLGILAAAIQGTLDTDLGIEQLNDAHVAAKSAWSPGQVTADLDRQEEVVLPLLESLQEEPNASTPGAAARPRQLPAARHSRHVRVRLLHPPALGHPRPARTADRPRRAQAVILMAH